MRICILFLLSAFSLFAQFSMTGAQTSEPKIAVQNSILAKVNGTTISMMDVKKRMDMMFYQHYPQHANSIQARFQFYEQSWRRVLSDIIDQELILADAADKEVKVTDGEIREEIEARFGPNVMSTLDQINVSYDEAWKMIKNEMIVQRMNWWFIQAKAISKVTPQQIKQGYRNYLEINPAYTQWKYRVLTIRDCKNSEAPEDLFAQIKDCSIDKLSSTLADLEKKFSCALSLSNEYLATDTELADSHRNALSPLSPGAYSHPAAQVSRDKKKVYRIFYLEEKIDHAAASFEEMAPMIKNELLQRASAEVSQNYLNKLRKHYRFDADHIKESLPSDLHPFSLQ